ncbi:MAG: DUF2087 domain-containing protein [Pseudomonadota bacterium]
MVKTPVELTLPDVAEFTKKLRAELAPSQPAVPGQAQMLGHVARAAGYANWQHLRAQIGHLTPPAAPVNQRGLERALRCYDEAGQFARWHTKVATQHLCMWPLWAALPARTQMTERQISARLDGMADMHDAARMRRTLVEMRLVERNLDGSVYLRVETAPPADGQAMIAAVSARRSAASAP